ncbi:fagellar hook-basal body protein [Caldicellulosiruptor kronotskyensis 2002]|uniref:Fagellar hook-basal body protein n=1 Tax=Caldicellulosiruptor kronotskyensis (strain DSM 18902 / VKM B-2412 / 2002) TaxID=632348 RepID=E4SD61_CALK2|nr:flagellar hook-basal body protein [Caldicellulosiruptor kronotskyensis]ADQ45125.1 fagellar hook-basal body protein [Caldicellulosiruptor kronotskyensis 2002]
MIRGIYTSASGMILNQKLMDLTANNVANVSTTGFKRDVAQIESFRNMLVYRIYDKVTSPDNAIGYMSLGADVSRIVSDFSQGLYIKTDEPLNLAIKGDGFFTIEVPENQGAQQIFYTRNGAFTLNSRGELVTLNGFYVLGQNGRIVLQNGGQVRIDEQGNVYQNGRIVDRLRVVDFQDKSLLRKVGNNLYEADATVQQIPFSGKVLQGYLEGSNVNSVQEMVNMINVLRAYEANQKAFVIQDETLQKAVNEIARK